MSKPAKKNMVNVSRQRQLNQQDIASRVEYTGDESILHSHSMSEFERVLAQGRAAGAQHDKVKGKSLAEYYNATAVDSSAWTSTNVMDVNQTQIPRQP